jgi:hypothetical protein
MSACQLAEAPRQRMMGGQRRKGNSREGRSAICAIRLKRDLSP